MENLIFRLQKTHTKRPFRLNDLLQLTQCQIPFVRSISLIELSLFLENLHSHLGELDSLNRYSDSGTLLE